MRHALLATLALASSAFGQEGDWRLVRVAPGAPAEVLAPFDHLSRAPDGSIEVPANEEDLVRLRRAGVPFEVVVEDLERHYAQRLLSSLGAGPQPPFGFGSMGGYYTFAEVVSRLDLLSSQWPNLVTPKFSIGTSIQGRDLWVVKVSDNPLLEENEPEVWFDALHHAREPEGMMALFHFLAWLVQGYGTDPLATYLVNEREIFFLPCANPDGYVHNETTNPNGGGMWRKNRRLNAGGSYGVDLNRNYGYQWGYDNVGSSPTPTSETYRGTGPFSEPESAAIAAFVAPRPIQTAQSIHTYSNLWLHPWGYTANPPPDLATFTLHGPWMTAENGYPYGTIPQLLYLANGNAIDWHYGVEGTYAYSVEIGSASQGGFWPSSNWIVPLAEANRLAFAYVAWVAGGCVKLEGTQILEIAGDGDGTLEPGETGGIVATVRNLGVSATATGVVLGLASADPNATVIDGSAPLGPVAALALASNAADPLTFAVSPAAAPGTVLSLTLSVAYEGYAETETLSVPVGALRTFARDLLEIDLGWTVGAPGDGAITGIWERVDPNGTSSGGQPVQPEDDHTPAPGVACFVTGNAPPGAPAGQNDVDLGPTTVLTPVFDLAAALEPRVAYGRWFADFTTVDDALVVSISNNGGATWTVLETVSGSNQNAWSEASFRVADFVAPTSMMRVKFVVSDNPNNSLCESAVDDFRVLSFNAGPTLSRFGAPSLGKIVALGVSGSTGQSFGVFAGVPGPPFPILGIAGEVGLLPATLVFLSGGALGAGGFGEVFLSIPDDGSLLGATIGFQAILLGGPGVPALTNVATATIG